MSFDPGNFGVKPAYSITTIHNRISTSHCDDIVISRSPRTTRCAVKHCSLKCLRPLPQQSQRGRLQRHLNAMHLVQPDARKHAPIRPTRTSIYLQTDLDVLQMWRASDTAFSNRCAWCRRRKQLSTNECRRRVWTPDFKVRASRPPESYSYNRPYPTTIQISRRQWLLQLATCRTRTPTRPGISRMDRTER